MEVGWYMIVGVGKVTGVGEPHLATEGGGRYPHGRLLAERLSGRINAASHGGGAERS
jgi:hypothetical protein